MLDLLHSNAEKALKVAEKLERKLIRGVNAVDYNAQKLGRQAGTFQNFYEYEGKKLTSRDIVRLSGKSLSTIRKYINEDKMPMRYVVQRDGYRAWKEAGKPNE